ncbi:MAG: 3' terminal RNA ribose 2'-O-methyltransferase Hen1 [Cyanobacteria bacterium J06634_5]
MLLTITTTHQPATDLGYLLHKHPNRCQSFPLSFGKAHVFYPEASTEKCTAALLLDIDPVGVVRGRTRHGYDRVRKHEKTVEHYISDRPYVASSFLSVAISKVLATALSGRCTPRPELAKQPIPFVAHLPVLPCRGDENFLRALFEPLGYTVACEAIPLDETFKSWPSSHWPSSHYRAVTLTNTVRLADLLSHLSVLIPVLDENKHEWLGKDEIARLLHYGDRWLTDHPLKEQIANKYLKRKKPLAVAALQRLMEGDDPDAEAEAAAEGWKEIAARKPITLNQQRLDLVQQVLKKHQAKHVIDLGCGEGELLQRLFADKSFERLTGVEVSYKALEQAKKRLRLNELPVHQSDCIHLMQGSLTYRDDRLQGYDAATVIEVIEHMDPDRLPAFERVLFEYIQPPVVIVTTPNSEFNVMFPTLTPGAMRHLDHRFEWTREEFQDWAKGIAKRHRYDVSFQNIGFEDSEVGSPTQMGVFVKGGK